MGNSSEWKGRGRFDDEVGAIRDVVQNHLLELVALLTMEPPVGRDVDALRDEKYPCVSSHAPARAGRSGARTVPGLSPREGGSIPNSNVETFAALRLHIDSWRWVGACRSLYRAGKCSPVTATEIRVEFKMPAEVRVHWLPQSPNYVRSPSEFRRGDLAGRAR